MKEPFGKVKLVRVIRGFLGRGSVDDEPANNSNSPISSDWAYEYSESNDEDIARSKNLLKGMMNALVEEDFSWDEFDSDEVDAEDIEELIEDGLDRYLSKTEIPTTATSRTFHVNCFNYPDPISEWKATPYGASLGVSLASKVCYLPLNFLQVGDIITAYNLVGDAVEVLGLTLDCKLVQVNKADPLTTTDIVNGAITQVTADGNFDVGVELDDTTVTTDKQYLLQITGTTGVGDSIYVVGAEVIVMRLI